MNNCFRQYIYTTQAAESLAAQRVTLFVTIMPTKAFFFFDCSEVNSTWLITSDLANQHVRKVRFTCAVYTNNGYTCRHLIVSMLNSRSGSLGSCSSWQIHVILCWLFSDSSKTLYSHSATINPIQLNRQSTNPVIDLYIGKFHRWGHSLRACSPQHF